MSNFSVEESKWKDYFNGITDTLEGKQVKVNVQSTELGNQTEAQNLPLLGISYDDRGKAVNVFLQNIEHNINNVQDVQINEEGGQVKAIQFTQKDGTKQILTLSEPLALPRH